ncbi:MAG: GNAT family N-acetyltransferase, partial [Kangiellaceae bacterium]|nr:GNAT family N-acetyltransferase [Kangiellaceae bacterium]
MQSEPIGFADHILNTPLSPDGESNCASVNKAISPFESPCFFNSLTDSGSCTTERGWSAKHLMIGSNSATGGSNNNSDQQYIPGYLKHHSYGEYVFDWSLANAFEHAGYNYYPKWVSQLPFTPIPMRNLPADASLYQRLIAKLNSELDVLTYQFLYYPDLIIDLLEEQGAYRRRSVHFRWHNNDYRDFDDMLSHYSRKRAKEIRRERRKVTEQNITIRRFSSTELTDDIVERFFLFYRLTYLKRSGHHGYLTLSFFQQWLANHADNLLIIIANDGQQDIAAALFAYDCDTLYGRYWGSAYSNQLLHFELCYYQGMEFCLENDLKYFNP